MEKRKLLVLTFILMTLSLVGMLIACSGNDETTTVEEPSCSDCHNETTIIVSRNVQWANSLHGSGDTFERNSADCANCHTSEGFVERANTGSIEIAAAIDNPSPINCRTCHEIHTTYTDEDWVLRVTEPVKLEITGDTIDLGKSNICASCHQPRVSDIPVVGGGDFEITSSRFGPHHGPQSAVLAGVGGYGPSFSGNSGHYSLLDDGCVACHMTDAYGKQSGGHTMSLVYEYHGEEVENTTACTPCHGEIEDFNVNGALTEIQTLADELNQLLLDQGLITESGAAQTGTFNSAQAGALWNYRTIMLEDRSGGIHNPSYAKFLLQTGIDSITMGEGEVGEEEEEMMEEEEEETAEEEEETGVPMIPHTIEGRENCLMCHETGIGGAAPIPADHAGRTNETCTACHQVQ